ncbi:MAG: phosphotransferase [Clostridium sp.]|nr:phosphotransferase [Clostridium sp.]
MENGWERTLPLVKINQDIISRLFNNIVNYENISNISLLDEGCRTTNYLVSSKNGNKYVLKIFFESDKSYKKDIALFNLIKKDIPVQEIYCVNNARCIDDREYIIYKYIEGKTISQYIKEGNNVNRAVVASVAHALGRVHNIKFKSMGSFDDNLNIKDELEPIYELYSKYINDNVKMRLGADSLDKIRKIVSRYEKTLLRLENDSRLIHGDFQGTNIIINDDSVSGVIDWEFCMAGCPLMDIGQFFRYEEYFNSELINSFEREYRKICDYELIDNWYEVSKILDLISLLQLMGRDEDMPNKYMQIKDIIELSIKKFY